MNRPLRILTYTGFSAHGVERSYAKVAEALAQGDFVRRRSKNCSTSPMANSTGHV